MPKLLQFLFLPHEANNQKAKALHLSSLFILLLLAAAFQTFLTLMTRFRPGVLGFASNINASALLNFTNQKRLALGLLPLKTNRLLEEAAREKASLMFGLNCWAHTCSDKTPWWFFKNVGYNYTYAGENLARDFGDSEAVVNAWMESPTHKDNIANPHYEEIGFAIVNGILNGEETTLVVQLFGTQEGKAAISGGEAMVAQVEGVMEQQPAKQPFASSFMLTKIFSLSLIGFLIILLTLDTVLIYRNQTARISGKSFIHLSFFIIILISILLSYSGQII